MPLNSTFISISIQETSNVSCFHDLYRGSLAQFHDKHNIVQIQRTLPQWIVDYFILNKQLKPETSQVGINLILDPQSDLPDFPPGYY